MRNPTPADIRTLVDSIPKTLETQLFIDTAVLLVDEQLSGKGLSDDRLDKIKLYLAAHYTVITVERGGLKSSKIDEATDTYNAPASGLSLGGIGTTRYGQQAIALDTTGILEAFGNGTKKAQFRIVRGGNGRWDAVSGTFTA